MNLFAFAATNHKQSINRKLLDYTTALFKETYVSDIEIDHIHLIDYELPLYRQDRAEAEGIPSLAQDFYNRITRADVIFIALAEHNGFYTAVYKNLFDWASLIDQKVYQDKPTLLMAASIGPNGGGNVLQTAIQSSPFFGMDVKASFSIPSFNDNFDYEKGEITNPELRADIIAALAAMKMS